MIETPVLIVGGGPVGLTLAAELGWRGVGCTLLETRTAPTEHPKATLLGARSMEYFRRWGITDDIYRAALPPEVNYFITFSSRLAGHELYRITSPSIRQTIERTPEVMARWRELQWSPFYKTQIGQQALEPVLWRFAEQQSAVCLRHGWRFDAFTEDTEGVTATATELSSGRTEQIRSRWLIACDGGTSSIRRALGIRYNGRGKMRANVSFYFRSREFLAIHGKGLGNLYFVFAPDSFGVFTAIDGAELWSFQYYFLDHSKSTDSIDAKEVLTRAVGRPFEFELQATTHWHHHQSVARRWRSEAGRVFLAGDAAHLFVPTGGVGMNTGIGDAIDLGWKLAAVEQGQGGPGLLESYEIERKPIAVRNSVVSANNSDKIDMVMDEVPPEIDEDGPAGEAARARIVPRIRWMSRQFNSAGLHLGYRYVDSPVILSDGTPEPPDDPSQVVPSTWPGARAPHAWLEADQSLRGRSTLDWYGRGWVLVHGSQIEAARATSQSLALIQAFESRGVSIEIRALPGEAQDRLYERTWVLVRPDGHVAWRADHLPDHADRIAATVLGFEPTLGIPRSSADDSRMSARTDYTCQPDSAHPDIASTNNTGDRR
jgi:2-polyprenyl-6-methoxyphenol hydroxylase-like FAD-dependent oxidoreductase